MVEDRGDELAILRAISFASAQGAAIDSMRLQRLMALDEMQFAKVLQRLVNEHAVRVRADGALTGLHELRSRHIDEAIRELLGDPRSKAITASIQTLVPRDFTVFLVQVFRRWPEEELGILEALATRLKPEEKENWTPVFHGLGLVTVDRVAEKWLEITRAAQIDDRFSDFAFIMAIANTDLGDDAMFANLKKAQTVFSEVDVPDLRKALAERVTSAEQLPSFDLNGTNELVASMLPIAGSKSPPKFVPQLQKVVGTELLPDILALLTTLREINFETVQPFLEMFGGTELLLDRLYNEVSWITKPIINQVDNMKCVTAYVRYIHNSIQTDLNDEVVLLCEAMAAAVPDADLLVSDVLFVDGSPFGYGQHKPNTKRLLREALPAPARVAWNRAQSRAVQRLIASPTETQRITALAQAIAEIGTLLSEAGDFYCRMEVPKSKWRLFLQVNNLLTTLIQPSGVSEIFSGPLELGELNQDKLHSFVTGLQRLMGELTDGISEKPGLMAARTADLAHDADGLLHPELWRMANEPPLEAIAQIRDTLWEIRAVLGDAARNPEHRRRAALRFGTVSHHNSVLQRAAKEARRRAENSLAIHREEIRLAMAAQGLAVEVFSRPSSKDDGVHWPDAEFSVLLKVDALIDWLATESQFLAGASSLTGAFKIGYGAVVNDHLAPMGMTFILSLLPSPTFAEDWAANLPYPLIECKALRLYDETVDAISTMSAITADPGRELNEKELEFLTTLLERYTENVLQLSENITNESVVAACESLVFMFESFQAEIENSNSGAMATDFLSGLNGSMSDLQLEILSVRLALMEDFAHEKPVFIN